MDAEIKYSTFKSVRPTFDALALVGYFKIVLKPISYRKRILHNMYRIFVLICVVIYNLQHFIRLIVVRHNTVEIVDTLFILLTTLNTFVKQASFNLRSRRVDNIINVINGPSFAASEPTHVEILNRNAVFTRRVVNWYIGITMATACMWVICPIAIRALGKDVQFTGYFPFDTSLSPVFEVTLVYMSIINTLQAAGNSTLDSTILVLYAQVTTQLQLLRYNLEHLADSKIKSKSRYVDDSSGVPQNRLKRCVDHYNQIFRYFKEIEFIFREALMMQFFISAWVICMTVYKIVGLHMLEVEFVSMALYLSCMLAQLFLYCYFGTQLEVESEFVNQSLYCSDWTEVSPKFRRQLLVMMQCCSRPLAPLIAYIIPMSLNTYIGVLKASYTLFAILSR